MTNPTIIEKKIIIFYFIHTFINIAEVLKRCPIADTECIKVAATTALHELPGGNSGINLAPIQPLKIPAIELKQGGNSPVNIKLSFTDVELHGLPEHRCVKVVYV